MKFALTVMIYLPKNDIRYVLLIANTVIKIEHTRHSSAKTFCICAVFTKKVVDNALHLSYIITTIKMEIYVLMCFFAIFSVTKN